MIIHLTPSSHSPVLLVSAHVCVSPTVRDHQRPLPQNFRHGALLRRGPWQYPNLGGSRVRVCRILPGHLRQLLRLLCAPLAALFSAHLALYGHPCLLPSSIPGLKHTSRRWNALRTPMSLGSVFPPPGLGIPGLVAVGPGPGLR